MRQQINLLQDGLVEKKATLRAGVMGGILAACGCLLLAASLVLFWQRQELKTDLSELNQEQAELLVKVQALKKKNAPRQKDPVLAQELKRKQAELAGLKPMLAHLEHLDFDVSSGFSPLIKGLAQYPLPGVWLSNIHLNRAKHKILLSGSAIRPELIPAYVQHLGEKRVFSAQTFASLTVTRAKEQSRQVDFRLESDFKTADE